MTEGPDDRLQRFIRPGGNGQCHAPSDVAILGLSSHHYVIAGFPLAANLANTDLECGTEVNPNRQHFDFPNPPSVRRLACRNERRAGCKATGSTGEQMSEMAAIRGHQGSLCPSAEHAADATAIVQASTYDGPLGTRRSPKHPIWTRQASNRGIALVHHGPKRCRVYSVVATLWPGSKEDS